MRSERSFFDFIKPFLIKFYSIHLIDGNNDLGNPKGSGKEYMFLRLLHHPIRCCNNKNCSISLRGTGDHVFDKVSVSRTVHNGEVKFGGIKSLVGNINSNTPFTFFL